MALRLGLRGVRHAFRQVTALRQLCDVDASCVASSDSDALEDGDVRKVQHSRRRRRRGRRRVSVG